MTEENKIVINKMTDLIQIPYSKLIDAKLTDLTGKYYEEIYNEALRIEKGEYKNYDKDDLSISDDDDNSFFEDEKKIEPINTNINIHINNNINNKVNYISNNNVRKITFIIIYNTIFGEEVGILGNINIFGNWKKDKIFYLKWHEGNKWIGSINYNDFNIKEVFEYKFVISYHKKVKKWEGGENNKIDLIKLYQDLIKNKKGKFNKFKYEYNDKTQELLVYCKWY
jgi:hypothetical protein